MLTDGISMKNSMQKEYGDYQTPTEFALSVCQYLKNKLLVNPRIVIEPTCGIGNFLNASLNVFPSIEAAYGIEINEKYTALCESSDFYSEKISIFNENFFSFNTSKLACGSDDLLIIGNPPWVTNSDLSFNLPAKSNFKKLSGIDAITGGSNFDICEYMILKLIDEYNDTDTMIAMLCKTSVARNVILELNKKNRHVSYMKILKFNANKVFGISASACLFVVKLSQTESNNMLCEVADIQNPEEITDVIKVSAGILSTTNSEVEDIEGECEFVWRQGVKHDCAGVMELIKTENDIYVNKNKEELDIEDTLVFPLLKSSSFKHPIINSGFKKYVIVTQRKARQETKYIKNIAPKTWDYLTVNKELFDKRKSSIYKGAPDFSMFGVGDYSYSQYKVGVSGFYKKALFCLVYNESDPTHTVMGDDTSYFLAFNSLNIAYTCMLLLNSKKVQDFLVSISFQDAKRPYTKKILQRISLHKASEVVTLDDLVETERMLGLNHSITDEMYNELKRELGGA